MSDAIVEAKSGLKFEVNLKEATADGPKRPISPPKERPLSQEIIDKKLKDAEERRLAKEAEKRESLAKYNEKKLIVDQKIAEQNRSFSEETASKQQERLDAMSEKKDANIKGLQERLRVHAERVKSVQEASERYTKMLQEKIKEKIEEKDVKAKAAIETKRKAQLEDLQNRLKEHEKKVAKVSEATKSLNKQTEEKLTAKMESTLRNRETQLNNLLDRLKEHDLHAQTVRQNKLNQSSLEDPEKEESS